MKFFSLFSNSQIDDITKMNSFFKMNLENMDYDETTNYNSKTNNEEKKSDGQIVKDALKDFDPKDSEAKKTLDNCFSSGATKNELLFLAQIISNETQISLERLDKKYYTMLLYWYHKHWNQIKDIVYSFQAKDENCESINLQRELEFEASKRKIP